MNNKILLQDYLTIIDDVEYSKDLSLIRIDVDDISIWRNIEQVKKIIHVLQEWVNSKELVVFNSKIVGESKPIPKLLINKKDKIITIDGIEFMVDGKIVKLSSKEFVKLQDLVLSIYYG